MNVELNKLKEKVILFPGDIKKVWSKIKSQYKSFDVIVMPRPQLKETFLKEAFKLSKKGTKIYYYDFSDVDKVNNVTERIKEEAKKFRKKIKILKIKKAGEIAPGKIRVRVDFKILR